METNLTCTQDQSDPTTNMNDGSHTGLSNEVADIFIVTLTFYALISAIFGISYVYHRHELLRDPQRVRWWDHVGLFMLGWAWPLFCCFVCRDFAVEWCGGRERRRRERMRRRERAVERQARRARAGRGDLEAGHGGVGDAREERDGGDSLWRSIKRRFPFSGLGMTGRGPARTAPHGHELEGVQTGMDYQQTESRGGDGAAAFASSAERSNLEVTGPPGPGPSVSFIDHASGPPNVVRPDKGKQVEHRSTVVCP